MKSQWPSQESWGTMRFVPLTIVSLLCFFHTWSCHTPAVPPLPHPSLPGNGHCTGAASLSLHALKNHLPGRGHQHHQNWLFFLCGYRENSPLQGLQGPVSMELSWKMLLGAIWGCSTQRDPTPGGTACLQPPLHLLPCYTEAPVWIWEVESAACPILQVYLHLTQRPLVMYWSHISALLSRNFT